MGFQLERGLSVAQVTRALRDAFAAAGEENPDVSARWIASGALEMDATALAVHADEAVSDERASLVELFAQRRLDGEPLQYITGTAPFWRLELDVHPGVFIPRPETEVLVEEALRLAGGLLAARVDDGPLRVLDLCCGSGTVGVSVAYGEPRCRVVACDISDKAVTLTRANARKAGVDDRLLALQGDLFDAVLGIGGGSEFDLVLSNPPYVPRDKMAAFPAEISEHEPREAFDGGADGLDVFRRILVDIDPHLKPGGYLLCELDEDMVDLAALLCSTRLDIHFDEVRTLADLTGRPRVVVARRAAE